MRIKRRFLALILAVAMLLSTDAIGVAASQNEIGLESKVYKEDISSAEVLAGKNMTVRYVSEGQKPSPKVGYEGRRLVEGQDFYVVYYRLDENGVRIGEGLEKSTEAGNYELDLQGIGEFEGALVNAATLTIRECSFADGMVRTENAYAGYEAGKVVANYELWHQNVRLEENADYVVKIVEDENMLTLIFAGIGNYSGSLREQFELSSSDVSWLSENYKIADIVAQSYTGSEITPEISIQKKDGTPAGLEEGTDYVVSYSKNKEAGNAQVLVKGIGKYAGSLSGTFLIQPLEMGNVTEAEGTSVSLGDICVELQRREYTYTGEECRPEVVVRKGERVLKEGLDYSLSGQDMEGNTVISQDAHEYYAVVSLNRNYSGQVKIKYDVLPVALDEVQINVPDYMYAGKEIVPTIEELDVSVAGHILSLEEKAGLVIKDVVNNVNVTDKAALTITGSGNFTGEIQCGFTINAQSIKDEKLSVIIDGIHINGNNTGYVTEWDGMAKRPAIVIKDGDTELIQGKDYSIEYRYNTEIGTARAIVTGRGNYCGVNTLFFEIAGKEFSEENGIQIVLPDQAYYYDGAGITPEVEVLSGEDILQNGVDYNVFYSDNKNAGTGKITVIGAGAYKGAISKTFTILPKTLEQTELVKIADIPKQRYTRKMIVPEIQIEIDGELLKKDRDYCVEAKNAVEEGTATLIVTGMGNYSGVLAEKNFNIYKTKITYVLNGGVNAPGNPDYYTIDDKITFAEPSRTDYLFMGWYRDRAYTKEVTGIPAGTDGNITLYARFEKLVVKGIDVSKWQGNIDWNQVKKSGVTFAIIRAGNRYGSSGKIEEDPYFRYNFKSAMKVGLKVGVYFYSQAINENEAIEEANKTLELIRKYSAEYEAETGKKAEVQYPVFIDTEYLNGGRANAISTAVRTACVKAFCKKVEAAGYSAGVYANKDWYLHNLYAGEFNNYCIWVAQYPKTYTEGMVSTYTGPHRIWQYTSSGVVSGISGRVDMNICYQDYIKK